MSNSRILIYGVSSFIRCVLHCGLGISSGLLGVALQFLGCAFGLELVRPDHVANALLCLAGCLIREAACLVVSGLLTP
jgi:hypothetical protein